MKKDDSPKSGKSKPETDQIKKKALNPKLPDNDPDQTPEREISQEPVAGKPKKGATNPKLPGNDPDQTPEREVDREPVAKKSDANKATTKPKNSKNGSKK
jgi:hypothetical protein